MSLSADSTVFVIGAPGSGKGTLCKRLAEDYSFTHISVGDLLRQLVSSSQVATSISNSVRSGDLISEEELAPIIEDHVKKERQQGKKAILLDGFPRRLDQAAPIEKLIGQPTMVLFFDCPQETAKERYLTRRLAGRETDNVDIFDKRYREFEVLNEPIVKEYQERGILLLIDTSRETEHSYKNVLQVLEGRQEM